jgi:Protein of unknown function (DUF1161)
MKTKLKVKSLSILSAVSVGAFIVATAGVNAWSEPLDCDLLTKEIEQKLIAKGVANYELSLIEKDESSNGKKVVGTCAGGTKKVLYVKTMGVSAAQEAAADYAMQSTAELIDSLRVQRNMNLYYNYSDMPNNVIALMQHQDNLPELIAALKRSDGDALVRFNLTLILNKKLTNGSVDEAGLGAINATLAEQLNDESAWVRTEAVWGLRFAPDAKYEAAVGALVDDSDQNVSMEARDTLQVIRRHETLFATRKDIAIDPWTRTQEVWGLTFSPDFEYEIRVRPESAQAGAGTQARATITEIRYKN